MNVAFEALNKSIDERSDDEKKLIDLYNSINESLKTLENISLKSYKIILKICVMKKAQNIVLLVLL